MLNKSRVVLSRAQNNKVVALHTRASFEDLDSDTPTCPECGVPYTHLRDEVFCPVCGLVYGYTYYSGKYPLSFLVPDSLSRESSRDYMKKVKHIVKEARMEFLKVVSAADIRYCEELLDSTLSALYELILRGEYVTTPRTSLPRLSALAILEILNPSYMVKLYTYKVVKLSRTAKKQVAAIKRGLERVLNMNPLTKALILISIVTGEPLSQLLEAPPAVVAESVNSQNYYALAKKYLLKKGYTKSQLHQALTPLPLRPHNSPEVDGN